MTAAFGPREREAAAQLAVLRSDRERLAERVRQPAWRGPVTAATCHPAAICAFMIARVRKVYPLCSGNP